MCHSSQTSIISEHLLLNENLGLKQWTEPLRHNQHRLNWTALSPSHTWLKATRSCCYQAKCFQICLAKKRFKKYYTVIFWGAVSDPCRQDDVIVWICALGSLVSWAPPCAALPPVFLHLSYISLISSSQCLTQFSPSPLLSSTRSLHLCFSTSLHLHLVLSLGLLSSVIISFFCWFVCCHAVLRSSSVLCVPAFLLPGF